MTEHSFYMDRAIRLAKNGIGFTNPNPLVGAVIVKNGRIIGEGYHARYGDLHAERNALKNCIESPDGGDLYVTLAPCCHYGKQPSCTDAILESGIRRVYIGSRDPNPLVGRKSVEILRCAGIEVHTDFLRQECDALNPIFFHYITTKMPYVILKYAMTADGKIACAGGASQWVTGEIARAHVQQTRKRVAAVCVGIGTVIADNPRLSCRCENPSQPLRVVLDTHLQLPLDSILAQTARQNPVQVFTHQPDTKKQLQLERQGVTVTEVPLENGSVSLTAVLKQLGQQGIDSVLIEGGAAIHRAALQAGLWNALQVYIAPKVFGGDGQSPVGEMGIHSPMEAVQLGKPEVTTIGEDILLTYRNLKRSV